MAGILAGRSRRIPVPMDSVLPTPALLIFGIAAAAPTSTAGDFIGVEVDPGAVIRQQLLSKSANACGPAAIANSLRFGSPPHRNAWETLPGTDDQRRIRRLFDRYFFGRESTVFPKMKRFEWRGVESEDLTAAFREFLEDRGLEPVTGRYLDRREGEKDRDFLARLYREMRYSLKAGVPPILGLRSFLAQRDPAADSDTAGEISWKPSRHHFVVITRIPESLEDGALGFPFELLDSNGGHRRTAFVFAEPQRPFMALRGNEQTGRWLSGKPFLLVNAPGVTALQPKDAVWRDRVVVIAHYLVGLSFGSP